MLPKNVGLGKIVYSSLRTRDRAEEVKENRFILLMQPILKYKEKLNPKRREKWGREWGGEGKDVKKD